MSEDTQMTETIDAEIEERPSQAVARWEGQGSAEQMPAATHNLAMQLPSEQMQQFLAEYTDRRKTFRSWLLSQMVQGVHYGVVPGCEVGFDNDGNMIVQQWNKRTSRYEGNTIAKDQYQHRPSLYKPGAQLCCDLLGFRASYELSHERVTTFDFRSKKDVEKTLYAVTCHLYDKAGELVGEGRGGMFEGEKGMSGNSAIKMAEKRAHVDAVLNTLALSDLFTQDADQAKPNASPDRDADAPDAPTRAQRKTAASNDAVRDAVRALFRDWCDWKGYTSGQYNAAAPEFAEWAKNAARVDHELPNTEAWTVEIVEACRIVLDEATS